MKSYIFLIVQNCLVHDFECTNISTGLLPHHLDFAETPSTHHRSHLKVMETRLQHLQLCNRLCNCRDRHKHTESFFDSVWEIKWKELLPRIRNWSMQIYCSYDVSFYSYTVFYWQNYSTQLAGSESVLYRFLFGMMPLHTFKSAKTKITGTLP